MRGRRSGTTIISGNALLQSGTTIWRKDIGGKLGSGLQRLSGTNDVPHTASFLSVVLFHTASKITPGAI